MNIADKHYVRYYGDKYLSSFCVSAEDYLGDDINLSDEEIKNNFINRLAEEPALLEKGNPIIDISPYRNKYKVTLELSNYGEPI